MSNWPGFSTFEQYQTNYSCWMQAICVFLKLDRFGRRKYTIRMRPIILPSMGCSAATNRYNMHIIIKFFQKIVCPRYIHIIESFQITFVNNIHFRWQTICDCIQNTTLCLPGFVNNNATSLCIYFHTARIINKATIGTDTSNDLNMNSHGRILTISIYFLHDIRNNWEVLRQNQVSNAVTRNYILQYLWDVITYPCPRYLFLKKKHSIAFGDGVILGYVLKFLCINRFI